MRKTLLILAFAALVCAVPALAQMEPGKDLGGSMEKLFGDNQTFSATLQTEISGPKGPTIVKSKMFYNKGDSRTELNMADVQSATMPAGALTQMKTIGMDKIVTITPSEKKRIFLIYPNIQAYVDMALPNAEDASTNKNLKVTATKIGDETVDGHPCVKNKTLVTDGAKTNEFTVWNAGDLKNFPVKIAMTRNGTEVTMSFQNVSFGKQEEGLFVPPPNFTRYNNIQELMRAAAMKHAGNPPAAAPTPNE